MHVKHPESKKPGAVTHIQTKVISELLCISETSSPKCMNFLNIAKTTLIRGRQLQFNGPCQERPSWITQMLGVIFQPGLFLYPGRL